MDDRQARDFERAAGDGSPDPVEESEDSPGPDDPERVARDAVYRLLSHRARSRFELAQALLRKNVDGDTVEAVLSKFAEAGLIDDAAFAAEWVRSRHRGRGLGRRALEDELRRKGVDDSVISAALADVDDDTEAERARELVGRKLRTTSVTDRAVLTRRLVAMLARKGYGETLALRVVRDELESSSSDD